MANYEQVSEKMRELSQVTEELARQTDMLAQQHSQTADPFIFCLTGFVLACFVGY
jgi:hypothetical protein